MHPENTFHKTRIAPTPSGFLHLGNVLSFAVTAALAIKSNARILLRIDDLDRNRVEMPYVRDIFDTLNFLEIPWHEGPRNVKEYEQEYSQLHRMHLYREALQQLKATGQIFACSCSRTQIAAGSYDGGYPGTCLDRGLLLEQADAGWRVTGTSTVMQVKIITGERISAHLPAGMHQFLVRKKDGFPAYQLTSLIDDLHFGIDLVVRGQDLWPSTLAQHYLAGLLHRPAFQQIVFHHHPLLLEEQGKKLSKSAGAASVQYLRKEGRQPADIYTMIAQVLGWRQPVHNFQELAAILELPEYSICGKPNNN